ncbi:MAG: hypothetical protein ACE366_13170 [Bradymonadia bacterium]
MSRAHALPLSALTLTLLTTTAFAEATADSTVALSSEAAQVQRIASEAYVRCFSTSMFGDGVLIGDNKTVITSAPKWLGRWYDDGRNITCFRGTEWVETEKVEIVRARDYDVPLLVMHLSKPLEGKPLSARADEPAVALDEKVYAVQATGWAYPEEKVGPTEVEVMTTRLTAVGQRRLSVGTEIEPATPVLDAEGRLLALADADGRLVRYGVITPEARPVAVNPILGLRFGTDFEGPLGEGAGTFELETGVVFNDRYAVSFGVGLIAGQEQSLYALEPLEEGGGPGVVSTRLLGASLSLEPRYQLNLFGPMYLDFTVGARLRAYAHDPQGPALYSDDPGCDPAMAACAVTVRTTTNPLEGDNNASVSFGPVLGVDFRSGMLSVGYRYQPEALSVDTEVDTHTLMLGIRFF